MRTDDEILERVKKASNRVFDFEGDVLIPYLPFDKAKEVAGLPDQTQENWDKNRAIKTKEAVIAEMKDYMLFAIEKAQHRRGLSAQRSIHKFGAWIWLLNEGLPTEIFEGVDDTDYGIHLLEAISKHYNMGFDKSEFEFSNYVDEDDISE